jgi:hypothetical protein
VAGAIVLLVPARALVLADDVPLVFVDGETAGDARLFVPAHTQAVEIEGR